MTQPYFEIGEIAIIQSPRFPEYNGECIVLEILSPSLVREPHPHAEGIYVQAINEYKYWTTSSAVESNKLSSGYVLESSLCKKHKPSTESFSELMNIKQPVGETQ